MRITGWAATRDSVSVARLSKGRCMARRWSHGRPIIGRPVRVVGGAGKPTSCNEA